MKQLGASDILQHSIKYREESLKREEARLAESQNYWNEQKELREHNIKVLKTEIADIKQMLEKLGVK